MFKLLTKCKFCGEQDVISDMMGVCLECFEDYEDTIGCKVENCNYCSKHQIHSGKGHNYDWDSCWKCEGEIQEKLK